MNNTAKNISVTITIKGGGCFLVDDGKGALLCLDAREAAEKAVYICGPLNFDCSSTLYSEIKSELDNGCELVDFESCTKEYRNGYDFAIHSQRHGVPASARLVTATGNARGLYSDNPTV